MPFTLKNGESFTVDLDLEGPDGPGAPMRVRPTENFPKELTVSKTYDRFFDGVDFTAFDEAGIEASLDEILADQTRVASGLLPSPDAFD